MKLKDGFLLREIAGSHIVVPLGQAAVDLKGMITLSGSGAFLWQQLQTEQTEASLAAALRQTYEVEETTAARDVAAFVEKLREHALIVE